MARVDANLNPCGDLDIVDGDLVLVSTADQIRVAWLIHMRTFLGEWYFNEAIGLPYYQKILGKVRSSREVRSYFIKASLAVPGILQVTKCSLGEIEQSTRHVDISIECLIEDGTTQLFTYDSSLGCCDCTITGGIPFVRSGDLILWMDGADTDVMVLDQGTNEVITMANKAGQGIIRGVAGAQPIYESTAMSGRGAIRFDKPALTRLKWSGVQTLRNGDGVGDAENNPFTVFVVYHDATEWELPFSGANTLVEISGSSPGANLETWAIVEAGGEGPTVYLYSQTDGSGINAAVVTDANLGFPGPEPPGVPSIQSYRTRTWNPGGTPQIYSIPNMSWEGELGYENLSGRTPLTTGEGFIGIRGTAVTANAWEGDIAEVLYYRGYLNDADNAAVMAYLGDKWGIDIV